MKIMKAALTGTAFPKPANYETLNSFYIEESALTTLVKCLH